MSSSKRSWLLQEFSAHNVGLSAAALGKKSGRVMATGGEDGQVNLWAVGNPNYVMKFTGHSSAIEALTFNYTEELVCAGSRSGQLRIWNISEGKAARNLTGHKAAISCLDFHSIGEFVASGSLDHKVKMWDYRRKGCLFTYTGHEGAINALQFSPDGRWMTSGSEDGTCKIWDLTAGKLLYQFNDHGAAVTSLQFHPNELLLATGGKDRTVKVYDVEQFKIVSSSKTQSSAVLKVIFSESGHCIYSVSQDMCHAYLWEPESKNTDSLIVKWGRPADVVIAARQLISATFTQNIVANYIVDLSKIKTSAFELPNSALPFQPPSTITPFSPGDNVTQRVQVSRSSTGSKVAGNERQKPQPMPSVDKAPFQNNFNNNAPGQDKPLPDNPSEVFNPRNTLSRSPGSDRPKSLQVNDEPRPTHVKPTPTTPHQATNILPHLTPDPAPSVRQVGLQEQGHSEISPPNPSPANDLKLDARASPAEEVPTRDQTIPEKLVQGKLNAVDKSQTKVKTEPNTLPSANQPTSSPLEESRPSTIVPAQRDDAIGLDMNAFLPAKKDHALSKEDEKPSDEKAILEIERGFESMRIVLSARHKNLEIVRAMWTSGDVMTAMNTAVRMKDQALLVDLFSVLNAKKSLWNLDLCQVMLPEVLELITSKYETYVTAACGALKIILRNFGQLIRSNISAPPSSAVDLSREERYRKCFSCNEYIQQIRTIVEKRIQMPGKVGTNFRELNILISSTFD